ncbi:MAG: VTT domain-containing protein [Gammaproteobacteria bacterium]|nr:VTT domain-containing protein [Gammaproteobacteria bacterium]MCW5583047.1 VTT domain-containing protein [Gammaproteobacteria bacterium]
MSFYTLIRKYAFLSLVLLISILFFYFDLYHYLTFDALKHYQADAQRWTITHYKSAVSIYVLVFTLLIACAIPCATFLTLLGGFLFGIVAVFYATFSTTCGGIILFLATRTAIGSSITKKSTGWIKKIEHGFQQNAFNYLLTLRLIPIFPCWISNIGAGMLNVPMKTFISATVLGVFPSTFVYTLAGRSLDEILANNKGPLLNVILTPTVFFPLLGLAILSIFPVIYKSIKKSY